MDKNVPLHYGVVYAKIEKEVIVTIEEQLIKDEEDNKYNRYEEIHYQRAYSIDTVKEILKKS